jgi:hypothetical protein
VNEEMKRNDGDMREVMRDTGVTFSEIFEEFGWKNYRGFVLDNGLEEKDKD